MKLYCLDVKLEDSKKLEINKHKYRLKIVNDNIDYPIKIISQNENIVSLYFTLDNLGYIQMNNDDKVAIFTPDKDSIYGIIIKKYKSIMS